MIAKEPLYVEAVVVGAGVVGLAIAGKLSPYVSSILQVESRPSFGMETSSRNSEVIHAGIHYPITSLKTELCIRGKRQLYDYVRHKGIPHRVCGKLVVATNLEEGEYLSKLEKHCRALEVPCERIGTKKLLELEPQIRASEALLLPETGIVDSHQYMAALEKDAIDAGVTIAYRTELKSIQPTEGGWALELWDGEEMVRVISQTVINASGLAAAEISNQALGTSRFEHRFCCGRYVSLISAYTGKFQRLIYPVPQKDGLGVHITLDQVGAVRLGPDVEWFKGVSYENHESLYQVDWNQLLPTFLESAGRYLPQLKAGDLLPGLVGIRPKLFVEGTAYSDFLIENHEGFIHCLGIESPGLTASFAIADRVLEAFVNRVPAL